MNFLEKAALAFGLTVAGVTLVYRYALSDEQREAVREAEMYVSDATQEITDSISPLVNGGPTHASEKASYAANRERTKEQWEALGY